MSGAASLSWRQKLALVGLLIGSFLFSLLSARDMLSTNRLSDGIEAKGQIVSLDLRHTRSSQYYNVAFSFEAEGSTRRGEDSLSRDEGGGLRVGQSVPVVYEKTLPSNAALGKRNALWRERGRMSKGVLVIAGLVTFLAASGFTIALIRRSGQ